MPVFQRNDGVTLKLGYMVVREEEGVLYTIKNIMVRADLSEVTVTLSPVEVKDDEVVEIKNEEMVCSVQDVLTVKSNCVALGVARDGMEVVARSIASCPVHVQVIFLVVEALISSLGLEAYQEASAGCGYEERSTKVLGRIFDVWQLFPGLCGLEGGPCHPWVGEGHRLQP